MSLQLNSSGGGSITLDTPSTASNRTVTLPDATTTLVGTDATQTLTNKTIQGGALTLDTAKTATGTNVDFTGIPSWVKRITVMFSSLSTNGTSNWSVQLGDSGGVETTGYESIYGYYLNAGASVVSSATSGFLLPFSGATVSVHGSISLSLLDAANNLWVCSGQVVHYAGTTVVHTAGKKTLSATLDRIRITTVNGTDTFDAGTINIMYEG